MTDSQCHPGHRADESAGNRFVAAITETDWNGLKSLPDGDIPFFGVHPWHADMIDDIESFRLRLSEILKHVPRGGIGETGLDRLKSKTVSPLQRSLFTAHLDVAAEFARPVVLHGAKCWGETHKECVKYASRIPSFLFHGFSRSGGLVKDIVSINGYFSVGPAILNDHAVNYRELAKTFPIDRILIESDCDGTKETPPLSSVLEKLASVLTVPQAELLERTEENAKKFLAGF